MERVGDHHESAVGTSGTQVMEPFQMAALALPVTDREVHKIKLRDVAEIGNWKHGGENGLKAAIVAFVGELIHLQKTLVGAALHLNQVGNLDGGGNLGKIESATNGAILVRHVLLPKTRYPRGSGFGPEHRLPESGLPACIGMFRAVREPRKSKSSQDSVQLDAKAGNFPYRGETVKLLAADDDSACRMLCRGIDCRVSELLLVLSDGQAT